MNIVGLLLYFCLAYLTYYKSQKYNANPYIWLSLGLVVPYLCYPIALLYFRKKKIVNMNPKKLPLGYRSKKVWKIVIASTAYAFLILFASIAAFTDTTQTTISHNPTTQSNDSVTDEVSDNINSDEIPGTGTDTSKVENTVKDAAPPVVTNENTQPAKEQIQGQLNVHFLDVGQADSILVQAPDKTMLIDAGNNGDSKIIVDYIKNLGINRIDVLIGTHPHEDHIGSLDTVINTFDIGSIYMPKVSSNTKTFEDVLVSVKNIGLKVGTAKAGVQLDLGEGVKAEMLAPNSDKYENTNDWSAVIKLVYGNTSFLFTGDAEKISEDEMINKKHDLKADVLKVGHHGSTTSSSPAFIKAVSPKYSVISVGKDNKYGHPDNIILNRLKTYGSEVFRTDESGTIVATSDGKTITFDKKASSIKPQAPPVTITESKQPPEQQAAKDAPKEQTKEVTVYVTKTGVKYHLDGCSSLSKSKIPTTLKDAKAQGYGPCSKCNPPQ